MMRELRKSESVSLNVLLWDLVSELEGREQREEVVHRFTRDVGKDVRVKEEGICISECFVMGFNE